MAANTAIVINPLAIPGILRKILKLLPIPDLLNCRVVCHKWKEEGTILTIEKTAVTFNKPLDIKLFMVNMELFEAETVLPGFCFKEDFRLNNPEVQEFFNKFGSQMKYLQLGRNVESRILKHILFIQAPNLQELRLKDSTAGIYRECLFQTEECNVNSNKLNKLKVLWLNVNSDAAPFIKQLLSLVPNLEKLIYNNPNSPENSHVKSAVLSLDFLFPHLKYLKLQCQFQEEDVKQLANNKYRLSSLFLILRDDVSSRSLLSLFSGMSQTLQAVCLDCSTGYTDSYNKEWLMALRVLKFLKRLNLLGKDVGSLEFIQDLSLLEYVNFDKLDLPEAMKFPFKKPNNSIKRFLIGMSPTKCSPTTIYKLGYLLPNLHQLCLTQLGDGALPVILQIFVHLEELIAGDFSDGCKELRPNPAGDSVYPSEFSNMKMRRIDLYYTPPLNETEIIRTLDLLLPCRNLQNLSLHIRDNITPKCIIKILDAFDLQFLFLGNSNWFMTEEERLEIKQKTGKTKIKIQYF